MANGVNIVEGVTIVSMERLRNSRDGGPGWRVTFDSGLVARTKPDSSVAHVIGNSDFQDVPLDVYISSAGLITAVMRRRA